MTETIEQYGARLAADAAEHAAYLAEPLTDDELRAVERGRRQLESTNMGKLQTLAECFSRPLERIDVLRAEAVRLELAARAGTAEEQVLRHVAGSRVLAVRSYSVMGDDDYSHQVRNVRYPGTEHSAGLSFDSRSGRWTNSSGMLIPAEHVLTYLRAYEEDPTYHPIARLQEITRR